MKPALLLTPAMMLLASCGAQPPVAAEHAAAIPVEPTTSIETAPSTTIQRVAEPQPEFEEPSEFDEQVVDEPVDTTDPELLGLLLTADETVGWNHSGVIAVEERSWGSAVDCRAVATAEDLGASQHHRVDGTVWEDGVVAATFVQRVVERDPDRPGQDVIDAMSVLDAACAGSGYLSLVELYETDVEPPNEQQSALPTAGLVYYFHGSEVRRTTVVWLVGNDLVLLTVSGPMMDVVRAGLIDLVDAKLAEVPLEALPEAPTVGTDLRPIPAPAATSIEADYAYVGEAVDGVDGGDGDGDAAANEARADEGPFPGPAWAEHDLAHLAPNPADYPIAWSLAYGSTFETPPMSGSLGQCPTKPGVTAEVLSLQYSWWGRADSYYDPVHDDVAVSLVMAPASPDFAQAELDGIETLVDCGAAPRFGVDAKVEPVDWHVFQSADEVSSALISSRTDTNEPVLTLISVARYGDETLLIFTTAAGGDDVLDRIAWVAGKLVEDVESRR